MKAEEIILAVSKNTSAMESLSENIRKEIIAFAQENEDRIRQEEERRRKLEVLAHEKEEKRKKAMEKEWNKLLCIGDWGEKVPRNRRFALCESTGIRLRGYPEKWTEETEYCAIDLVRGVKSPYWGYFGASYPLESLQLFYDKRVKDILEAQTVAELVSKIRSMWDFFFIDEHDDLEKKFSVLTYEIDDNGRVKILSRSELKTWEEHRDALKKEFCP